MDRVLVFAPHIDDAEFGMGGYLHRMVREKTAAPHIIILTNDSYMRQGRHDIMAGDRLRECQEAMEIIGCDWELCRMFEENHPRIDDFVQLVGFMETRIRQEDPAEVFCCLPSFNQDHKFVYDAFITATRPMEDGPKRLWLYGYPGNCWGPPPPDTGVCYVRLSSDDFNAKQSALKAHRTQFEGRGGHITPKGSEALDRLSGSECGADWAEKFWLLREVY